MFGGLKRLAGILDNRNYRIYASGNAVSLVGMWMQRITAGWLAWELTGSATWLGLLAFADLFPTVFVGFLAGAAADRWSKLHLTRISQSLSVVQALFLAGFSATGNLTIGVLLATTLFQGTVASFNQPSRLAMISLLVPRDMVHRAVALNSVIFNCARFVGPPIAGALLVTVGPTWTFLGTAATYATFVASLAFVRLSPELRTAARSGLFSEAAEGLRYTLANRSLLLLLLLLAGVGMFGRSIAELLPGFAAEVFDSGPIGLSLLSASLAVGAVAGGVWIGGRDSLVGLMQLVAIAAVGAGAGIAAFTLSSRLVIAMPLLAVSGFFLSGHAVGTQTLVQMSAEDAMRGRVLSLHGLIFRASPAVGALMIGATADVAGLHLPVAAAGLLVIACGAGIRSRIAAMARDLEK